MCIHECMCVCVCLCHDGKQIEITQFTYSVVGERKRERERIHYFIALFVNSERECGVFFRSTFVLLLILNKTTTGGQQQIIQDA